MKDDTLTQLHGLDTTTLNAVQQVNHQAPYYRHLGTLAMFLDAENTDNTHHLLTSKFRSSAQ